jgi:hypothetical protein
VSDEPQARSPSRPSVGILEARGPQDPPFVFVETTPEERFRAMPTVTLRRLVSYGTLLLDIHKVALAELARRDTPHPCG